MSDILNDYLRHYEMEGSTTEFAIYQVVDEAVTDLPTFWGPVGIYSKVVGQLHERAARWCEKNGHNVDYAHMENVWSGGSADCQCPGCADCWNNQTHFTLENGDLAVIFVCQPLELQRMGM